MRSVIAVRLELIGTQLNQLRNDLLQNGFVFTAGVIRAAEETVLVVYNMFSDTNVADGDL